MSADSSALQIRRCQSCGNHVTRGFAQVFGDDEDRVHLFDKQTEREKASHRRSGLIYILIRNIW